MPRTDANKSGSLWSRTGKDDLSWWHGAGNYVVGKDLLLQRLGQHSSSRKSSKQSLDNLCHHSAFDNLRHQSTFDNFRHQSTSSNLRHQSSNQRWVHSINIRQLYHITSSFTGHLSTNHRLFCEACRADGTRDDRKVWSKNTCLTSLACHRKGSREVRKSFTPVASSYIG